MRQNLKTCDLKFQFKWAKNVKIRSGNGVLREPKMRMRPTARWCACLTSKTLTSKQPCLTKNVQNSISLEQVYLFQGNGVLPERFSFATNSCIDLQRHTSEVCMRETGWTLWVKISLFLFCCWLLLFSVSQLPSVIKFKAPTLKSLSSNKIKAQHSNCLWQTQSSNN